MAIGAAVALVVGGGGGFAVARATSPAGATAYVPISPCRLFDTRPAPTTVGPRAVPLGEGETMTVAVWGPNGNCAIPSTATAITINLTAAPRATANTFLTMWPAGAPRPNASNLNVKAGDIAATPNLATVTLSASGAFNLYNAFGQVNVIGDVLGYSTGHDHDDRYPTKAEVDTATGWRMSPAEIAMLQWWKHPQPAPTQTELTALDPADAAVEGTRLWLPRTQYDVVTVLDTATGGLVHQIPVTGASAIEFDGTSMWVASRGVRTLTRIDAATGAVTGSWPVGSEPFDVLWDGSDLWVSDFAGNAVLRIDRQTGDVLDTVLTGSGSRPTGLATDGRDVWVALYTRPSLARIDTRTRTVALEVGMPAAPWGITFDGTHLWTADIDAGSVTVVDPRSATVVARYHVAGDRGFVNAVRFDGTSIWVALAVDYRVVRLDPANGRVLGSYPIGTLGPRWLAYDGTGMWVDNGTSVVRFVIPR